MPIQKTDNFRIRPNIQYSAYGADSDYAAVFSVANNTVMEQAETVYDAATNAIQVNQRMRYHNAAASQLGALQNPSVTPNARVTYVAIYPDPLGRTVNTANYGTNGGTTLTRQPTCPLRSAIILVNSTEFDSARNIASTIDPNGTMTCTTFDAVGRKLAVTANCITSSSSSSSSSSSTSSSLSQCSPSADSNVVTQYTYTADGMQATVTAVNAQTGNQTTAWTYGTTLSNSEIASSQLLLSVTFPDSASGSDVVAYSYNRQGEKILLTDQRGCVHTYLFDLLGRQTNDCVTTLGSGVDNTVLQLATRYEVRGMIVGITSYGSATAGSGTVINDCLFVFNNFSQLVADYQNHHGAVNTATTSVVQYGYANGSANTIRPTTLIYPNGRLLNYNYGTSGGLADSLSVVASLIDNDGVTHLADYSYVGKSTPVVVISGITNSVGPTWTVPAYDAAGNTTTLPQPVDPSSSYSARYDAWNRLMTLSSGSETVQTNEYDARSFRTIRTQFLAGVLSEARQFYYSSEWQSLEEWVSTVSTPERQQVWGLQYVDDLLLRDRDSNRRGSLNERLYGLQDETWNTVALISTTAVAQERYCYSPFGILTFLNGTMSAAVPESAISSEILFTARRFDATSLFHCFRTRYFASVLGNFTSRDSLTYPNGINCYAAWFVPGKIDPTGQITNEKCMSDCYDGCLAFYNQARWYHLFARIAYVECVNGCESACFRIAGTVPLWDLGYGRYCGPTRRGPGKPNDKLDEACADHDKCLETVWEFINPCTQFICNTFFCDSAADPNICVGSPTPVTCQQYAKIILLSPFCYS